MRLLCIDPGTTKSGVVVFDGKRVSDVYSELDNEILLDYILHDAFKSDKLAIEMIASMGMAVGVTTFETCVWIGRFMQAYGADLVTRIKRHEVKMCLCHSMRAKDSNIRQAILDRFPTTGGGKTPQVGIKKQPGPLFGVSKHAWAALAVGITYFEERKQGSS